MGALVTVKVRPGSDVQKIKADISRQLYNKTGQIVTVNVTVQDNSNYIGGNNESPNRPIYR